MFRTNPLTAAVVLAGAGLTPAASGAEWYEEMQIGPIWSNTFADTYEDTERVAATKGILITLGDQRALFDTETLSLVTVYDGGLIWGGTPWTGAHGQLVKLDNADSAFFNNPAGPGWADSSGSFEDPRETRSYALYTHDRDRSEARGRFGNIPHLEFHGYYRHGERIVLDYEVNGTRIHDAPYAEDETFYRMLRVAPHRGTLITRVADDEDLEMEVSGPGELVKRDGALFLNIPAARQTETILLGGGMMPADPSFPEKLTAGGEGLWPEELETEADVAAADEDEAWLVDTITLPEDNPWDANLRFGGFDFIDADTAALSSWNGDVWIVSGLEEMETLTWKRFASGLFEPLGLKVVDGVIHVNGRDQITRLHDLNADGEADHYESFNRDVEVSPNFHEFAFGLETDDEGNFYFSKAAPVRPGGRGFDLILKHHGTVVKVSPDGSSSEVVATGLRAPGGLGVGPQNQITTGENEGTWQPCCKINFMTEDQRPEFFGTEPTRHGVDEEYREPLCYLPMDVDNSGGSQVWVPEDSDWGLKPGELLHLSYGTSTIFRVLPERIDGTLQGGVAPLPVNLLSSAMRACFHPDGDSLYVVGFRGWQTNAATEHAFHRIRRGEAPVPVPEKLEVTPSGVRLTFEVELDEELATDPFSYSAERWDYVRGPQYGSGEFSVDDPDREARELALQQESKGTQNRDRIEIGECRLLDDGKTVEIDLEGHKPSMSLKVAYDLETADGRILMDAVHSTVHTIPD